MKLKTCTALFLAITAIGSTATADDLVVSTGVSTAYYTDPSFDAISDYNSQSNWVFSAAWGFDRLAGLRLGILFQTTPRLTESRFGGELRTEWGRQRFLGTADWGFTLWRHVRPHVMGGFGYAHQFLSLESIGPRLKDHAHDLTGQLAGGIDGEFPLSWGHVALTTLVGYELQTPATFDELRHDKDAFEADYAPDDDPWDRARADFGTLRMNGVFWTVGVNVAFDF